MRKRDGMFLSAKTGKVIGSASGLASCLVMFAALSTAPAWGGTLPVPPPRLHVPHTDTAPLLTGAPDDPAWKKAAVISEMTVSLGLEAQGLTALPTRAYLLWDANYLYIRFVCEGGSAQSPYKNHDDPLWHADTVEVFLDPKGDGRQWAELEVSPNNVVFDQISVLTAEPESKDNGVLTDQVLSRDWWTDPAWNLEGLRTASGRVRSRGKTAAWIVDMAVPADPLLRRLGIKSFRPMNLRANLLRYETAPQAEGEPVFIPMNWAPVLHGCPHISPAAMGFLVLDPPTHS